MDVNSKIFVVLKLSIEKKRVIFAFAKYNLQDIRSLTYIYNALMSDNS